MFCSMDLINFSFDISILLIRLFIRIAKYKDQIIRAILIFILISGRDVSISFRILQDKLISCAPNLQRY